LKKAVFLDRDGVINEVLTNRVKFVNNPNQFYLLEGVGKAIQLLNEANFAVFVVTNQGGIGLGYMKEKMLERIHQKMKDELALEGAYIDDIAYCPHKPHEGCECRKPKPNMILSLAKKHGIVLSESYMVGDRNVDIEAGKKAGTKTILIGKDQEGLADAYFNNLLEAVQWILKRSVEVS
jgi:D-glycero-D-manno-heptose 1,7-bisphosphate phosphatase